MSAREAGAGAVKAHVDRRGAISEHEQQTEQPAEPDSELTVEDLEVPEEQADEIVGGLRIKAIERDPTVAGQP